MTVIQDWRRRRFDPVRQWTMGPQARITYLLHDRFDTAAAAPLASPRACEPGPGQLTIVDTGNQMSIAAGILEIVTGAATPRIYVEQTTYPVGRAAFVSLRTNDGSGLHFGLSITTGTGGLARIISTGVLVVDGALNAIVRSVSANTLYPFAFVRQGNGAAFFIKDPDWTLLWISFTGLAGNDVYFHVSVRNTNAAGGVDYMRVRDLPAPFNVDDGLCVVDVAAPVGGTAYTSVTDAISDLTVTAPGVLDGDANTRCGLYYRTDADQTPAWHLYVDGQGRFRLDGIAADGSRTNYINVAGVIAGGATITLRGIYDATLHNCYSLAGATWTKRGGEINVSLNDAVTRVIPEAPAGWTLGALKSWARRSSVYAELDRL